MRARDLMSRPVYTVRPDTSIEQAAALLADHGFAAAPVVGEDGRLLGIVAEADLLRDRIPPDPVAHLRRDPPTTDHRPHQVAEVMSPDVVTMVPDADPADLAAVMLDRRFRSIPIVERGEVVGVVSRRDLLRGMVRTDDMVTIHVQRRLDEYAGGRRLWTAVVVDGVVQLSGDFDDDVERRVVTVLTRTVPGVVDVRIPQLT